MHNWFYHLISQIKCYRLIEREYEANQFSQVARVLEKQPTHISAQDVASV